MARAKTKPDAPKAAAKKNAIPDAKEAALAAGIDSLRERIEKIERKQKVIVDGFEFAANELRPMYGLGGVAQVFDAIYRKLAE